ncbi:MAG: S4 domain-containing protein [Pseudomonadota bacterium]
MADPICADATGQRLDKWLCYARFVKTRTLAQALVEGGKVRVNKEKIRNSARALREGDVLTLRLAREVRVVRVIGFAERRVSPAQTALLYEALALEE